jgi:hypothetical protein
MTDHRYRPEVEILSVADTGRRRRWTDAEMGWMPLTPYGIAMCHTRGVETQVEGEGIHGRS